MEYKRIARPRWAVVGSLLAIVILLTAAAKVVDVVHPDPEVGHWRDEAARSRYVEAYRDVLATAPAADRTTDVATTFGTAHVLAWDAPGGKTPVLLVPGHSSGAPMWVENLPQWIGTRPVYAFDPIGDAGLSTNSVPMRSPQDQARWVAEAVRGLGLTRVHVVGHSFGGAVAAQLAVDHPDVVASLSLAEPVVVAGDLPASIYLWSAVLALPTPQSWRDRALAEIGGTTVEEVRARTPMSVMVDTASSGYSTALPMPAKLTDDEWRGLRMPVRLDIGGASEIAGGQGSADRVRSLLPKATVTTWPDASHSLPMDEKERWGRDVAAFWSQAEARG